jgi:hypothetical protein
VAECGADEARLAITAAHEARRCSPGHSPTRRRRLRPTPGSR